jgi:hypothetical protein
MLMMLLLLVDMKKQRSIHKAEESSATDGINHSSRAN